MRAGPDRLVLRDEGPRQIVCVPFAGGSARSFTPLARALGPGWRVIAVQPVTGPARRGAGLDGLARYYLDLLAEDLRRPGIVFGHSLGAAAVHRMALLDGARWPRGSRLVLSAPPWPALTTRDLLSLPDEALLDAAVGRGLLPALPVPRGAVLRMVLPDLRGDLAVLRDEPWVPEPAPVPARLVGGRSDPGYTPAGYRELAAVLGCGAAPVAVRGGHLHVVERPSGCARVLRGLRPPA